MCIYMFNFGSSFEMLVTELMNNSLN